MWGSILAAGAWIGGIGATVQWARHADYKWRQLLEERGLIPRSVNRFADVQRLRDLGGLPDEHAATELWRLRANRRFRLIPIVALVGLAPLAAATVVPLWANSLPWSNEAVAVLFLVGVLALFVILGARFIRWAVQYGNGTDISLTRLLGPASGIALLLLLLLAWALFR